MMITTRSDELAAEVYSAIVRVRAGSYMVACLVFSSELKGTSKNDNAIKYLPYPNKKWTT